MTNIKRVAVVNSLACFGKSSITVALPILSSAGIETAVIPTSLFSTHTGIQGYTFHDLTDDILPIAQHWNSENVTFNAVCCGYLCNEEQIFSVIESIGLISNPDTLIIVDPILGDNGKLYSRFTNSFPGYMLKLCRTADVIVPNITEACFLTNTEYKEEYDEEYILQLAEKLSTLTDASVVITGVCFDERKIGVAIYENNDIKYVFCDKVPVSYHGSGDIFTSGLIASLVNDRSLRAAAQIAQNFVCRCIKSSYESGAPENSGILFEPQISNIMKYLDLQ